MATLLLVLLATPVLAEPEAAKALHPEDAERVAFQKQIREMMRLGQFDELERTGRKLIDDDPRFSCGVSKLVDFYLGLDEVGESGPEGIDARMATFRAWAEAKPTSHWPKVGFASMENSKAWKARGRGFAREVKPEGWDGFRKHMAVAMEWGRKALADDPRDPNLLALMIGLCRDADCPMEDADRWMASAIAMNPNYDAVYVAMANSLVPRWRGSSDEFVAFAEKVSDENKALGNIAYARIATVGLLFEGDEYRETYPGLQWERIQSGLREIDKRYPDSARTYHLLARFARQYEDRAVAREAMLRLDPAYDADAKLYWGNPIKFANARRWALGDGTTDQVTTQIGTYPVGTHGWLVLAVPQTFKQSHEFLSEPAATQLFFRPEIGDAFYVQATSVWLDEEKRAQTTPAFLRGIATKSAEGPLARAIEKEARLEDLNGSQTRGFHYGLTDSTPEPGDYAHMDQGVFVTGDVMTVFTILYRDATCPDCDRILHMFEAATYNRRKARSR